MVQWLDEMLAELEGQETQRKLEFDKLKADQALGAIGKLEADMAAVNKLADDEIKLIENYRTAELERIEKKRSWLLLNLEAFIRKHTEETGDKSLRLPHGSIGLRKSRDRVEISNPELFEKAGLRLGLFRTIDAKTEPDLQAVSAAIKIQKSIPGVTIIPGSVNFHYSINGGNNGKPETETE